MHELLNSFAILVGEHPMKFSLSDFITRDNNDKKKLGFELDSIVL